ncbi:MAG: peptidase U32 family protein [Lachnospiraceae bacterium]
MQYLEEGRRKMSKILLKINDVKELSYEADGYILGIDKYSFLFGKTFNIDEIKKIKDDLKKKEIFVSFNRVIFNDELEDYKMKLKEVDDLGINGIIVGDIAALTYDLKTNIILDQMHLNNSFYAINHYYNNGVYGTVLTNDITLSEINDIKKNTKSTLFKQVFGYPHLSTSKRKLISNYKEYFNINDTSSIYEISEKNSNNIYKIIEDNFGTHILGDKVLNLLSFDIDVDYKIVDGFMLGDVKKVLEIFMNNKKHKNDWINDTYNANYGFINKETIYRVKKDER